MLTRRGLLAAGGASALTPILSAQGPRRPPPNAKPILTIGFLTDCHLPSGGRNDEFTAAINLLQRRFRAGLILFGGDNVYAAETGPRESANAQLENWQRLTGDVISVGHASVLGNHDCWGLAKGGAEFESGRKAALRAFGMPSRYYAFERMGWRFLMLDTIRPSPNSYRCTIDEEQMDWIDKQLTINKPTIIVGHAPVVSAAIFGVAETQHKSGAVRISEQRVLSNGPALLERFRTHRQVKLYLSGHLHIVDRCRIHGTDHVCAGAVCGGWWRGGYEHFGPHAAVINLFPDGTINHFTFPLTFIKP